MDETFLITIKSFLFYSTKNEYTMFIDTAKISIVYELVEWIRWIFSIENCIYLTHKNLVIHELEDIRILSKLKNFEIKPCEEAFCVHKKKYRTLLDNLNLFVNWNEVKVHRYFLEKVNQMKRKLAQEKSRTIDIDIDVSQRSNNMKLSLEKSYDIQSSNSNVKDYPRTKKALVESVSVSKSSKINNFNKKNSDENLLINFDDNSDISNSSCNESSKNISMTNFVNSSPEKQLTNVKSELNNSKSSRPKSNSHKSSHRFVRPFSLGQILSNIREDLEKQKNDTSHIFTDKGNIVEVNSSENSFVPMKASKKKRRRIRKRKIKKENLVSEHLVPPNLESISFTDNYNAFHSNTSCKPNHIRFDAEEDEEEEEEEDGEENLMETDFVEDKLKIENEIQVDEKNDSKETFLNVESMKLSHDNCQNLSNLVVGSSESKMESTNKNEDEVELENQVCDNFKDNYSNASFLCNSFDGELNTLESLKEKFKNTVVVKRFY